MRGDKNLIGAAIARKKSPDKPVGILIGQKGCKAIIASYPFGILYLGLNSLERYIPISPEVGGGFFTFKAMLLKH